MQRLLMPKGWGQVWWGYCDDWTWVFLNFRFIIWPREAELACLLSQHHLGSFQDFLGVPWLYQSWCFWSLSLFSCFCHHQLLGELSKQKTPFAQVLSTIHQELDKSVHSSNVSVKHGDSTFQRVSAAIYNNTLHFHVWGLRRKFGNPLRLCPSFGENGYNRSCVNTSYMSL